MRFLLLALLLTAAVPKRYVPKPKIVERGVYRITGCSVDPITVCEGEWLVIENLSFKYQDVVITCGDEFDQQTVALPPRTRFTVNIDITIPVEHPACRIK